MTQIIENNFKNFCIFSQKMQKVVDQIRSSDVTEHKRIGFHNALESLQNSLDKLKKTASGLQTPANSLFSEFDAMESQIVSLYREVEERFEQHEVEHVTEEALNLTNSIESGKMGKIAKQVHTLRQNILFLFNHRRPSMQHRKVINLALKLTVQAEEVLSKKGKNSKDELLMIQLLKTLLREAVSRVEEELNPIEAEIAIELCEISDLFNEEKFSVGKLRLNLIRSRLTKWQLKRLDAAATPKEIIQALHDIAFGDPCAEWEKDTRRESSVIHILQA